MPSLEELKEFIRTEVGIDVPNFRTEGNVVVASKQCSVNFSSVYNTPAEWDSLFGEPEEEY